MTIIYISKSGSDTNGNGSQSLPYRTIKHAIAQADVGDIIDGQNDTFSEIVNVDKSIAIIRNMTVDGLWNGQFPVPVTGVLPGGDRYNGSVSALYKPLFLVSADDVTVENVICKRSSGRSFQTHNPTKTVKNVSYINCTSTGAYNMSWQALNFSNLLIENCISYENGLQGDDPNRPVYGIPVNIQNIDGENLTVRGCTIYRNRGEQLGVQQGVDGFLLEDNLIYDGYRMLIYLMWCKNGIVRRNQLCNTNNKSFSKRVEGIYLGWEHDFEPVYGSDFSDMNVLIENNLIVGTNRNLHVAYNGTLNIHGARNITFRYNTCVNARHDPGKTNGACIQIPFSDHHAGNVVYGNVFEQDNGAKLDKIDANVAGWHFEGNYWSQKPSTIAQSALDIYGNGEFTAVNTPIDMIDDLDPHNYQLTAVSHIINAGPPEPPSDDLLGHLRNSADMGALAFNGSAPTLTANFAYQIVNESIPATVQFTDQSIGDVHSYDWSKKAEPHGEWESFSSTPNIKNPIEHFQAGTWSIKLRLNDGEIERVKQNIITVDETPAINEPLDLVIDTIHHKLPEIAGVQTYHFSLNGKLPKTWKIEITRSEQLRTVATPSEDYSAKHAQLSIGYGDALGNGAASAIFSRDGLTPTETSRRAKIGVCGLTTNRLGDVLATAEFVSVGPNQLTLNWMGQPNGEVMKITAFAGDAYQGQVGTAFISAADEQTVVTTPFTPNIVDAHSIWHDAGDSDTEWSALTTGVLLQNNGQVYQACYEVSQKGGRTETEMRGRLVEGGLLWKRSLLEEGQPTIIGDFNQDGFSLTPIEHDVFKQIHYLAHHFPRQVWAGVIDAPTDNRTLKTYATLQFQPEYLQGVVTLTDGFDNLFDNRANVMGLVTHSAGRTYTAVITSTDEAIPSQERSCLTTDIFVPANDNSALVDMTLSPYPDGFLLNSRVSHAQPTKWLFIAISE